MTLKVHNARLTVDGTDLLREIYFELAPGEVVVVVGANGAGKSSLLRVLSAENALSGGLVTLDGKSLGEVARGERARRLAVLPQHSTLDFPFTVCEVIEMGRIPHATGSATNKQMVAQVMDRLKLTSLGERIYTTLSGGEKQRVQIARILCQLWDCLDASYLLFDEPTAPLDLAHQLAFLDVATELARRGAGVLLVMHDINLAVRCAGSMVIMKAGRIIAAGKPGEVVTPENIREAFDVEVTVVNTDTGNPLVHARSAVQSAS